MDPAHPIVRTRDQIPATIKLHLPPLDQNQMKIGKRKRKTIKNQIVLIQFLLKIISRILFLKVKNLVQNHLLILNK